MAVDFKLKGLDKVLRNLNKEIKNIEGRSLKGLIRGAAIVKNSMDKDVPKIPVDTRNLQSSFFVVSSTGNVSTGSNPNFRGDNAGEMSVRHSQVVQNYGQAIKGKEPTVVSGFTANYALPVHEDIGANFKRPGAGAKFFEVALQRNQRKILEVIAKEAKIK